MDQTPDPEVDELRDPSRVVELLSANAFVPRTADLIDLISAAKNPGAAFYLVEARVPAASLSEVREAFDRRGGPSGAVIGGDVHYLADRLTEVPSDEVIIGGSVWDATGDASGWEAQVYLRRVDLTLLGFLTLRLGPLAGSGNPNAN